MAVPNPAAPPVTTESDPAAPKPPDPNVALASAVTELTQLIARERAAGRTETQAVTDIARQIQVSPEDLRKVYDSAPDPVSGMLKVQEVLQTQSTIERRISEGQSKIDNLANHR